MKPRGGPTERTDQAASAPRSAGAALRVLAALYLAGVWLDGVGSTLPFRLLPRAPNYFLQVAALFPRAATRTIDYRAEAWVCGDKAWRELDTRPYFPMDADGKENRFQRVMHFFRQDERTMLALDDYLVRRHDSAAHDDGIERGGDIGGVRLSSLRIPLPVPGGPIARFERRPIADYPEAERHIFYHTRRSTLARRCGRASQEAE
ncbi:MAG: hypothetical protein ACREJ3_04100 [Polyangiaceae bacterium]